MKLAIIDIETSGLDPREHEIIDIACIMDGKEFHTKVKPTRMEYASEEAIKINGYTPEKWADAVPLDAALIMLNDFVRPTMNAEPPIFMAYNVAFDWGFVYEAYRSTGVPNPFTYQKLCLMSIAWSTMSTMNPPSLKAMCTKFLINPEPAVHEAINGAWCAFKIAMMLNLVHGKERSKVAGGVQPISP
jgi:DNA polymerase III epsilon subunit-like protein